MRSMKYGSRRRPPEASVAYELAISIGLTSSTPRGREITGDISDLMPSSLAVSMMLFIPVSCPSFKKPQLLEDKRRSRTSAISPSSFAKLFAS